MTSSNGNIFRVTGPLCGEFTGPGEFPTQRPVTRSFDVFFDLRLNKRWVNNREAGNLRRYRPHYCVIVMNMNSQVPVVNSIRTWTLLCLHLNQVDMSLLQWPYWFTNRYSADDENGRIFFEVYLVYPRFGASVYSSSNPIKIVERSIS